MKVYKNHIAAPSFTDENGRYDARLYEHRIEKYLAETKAWVVAQSAHHPLTGKVVRTPYADGYAEYMVAKFDGKVCLVWLEVGDAWRDSMFERAATITMLKDMAARAEKMDALFGGRR
jgi:hypothetical protein